jgi:type VI secretion system secreted protein Hcp
MKYRHYVPAVAFSIGLGFAILFAAPAQAAVDMFIKIEGIDGESRDSKHNEWIDVLAWSWGASSSGGSRTPQPSQTHVLVAPTAEDPVPALATRELDKSSAKLQQATVTGASSSGMKATQTDAKPMANNSAPRSGSGRGDLSVTKYVDKASPKLQQYCSSGGQIPQMEIASGKKTREGYLTYELTNVRVTSCQPSSSGGTVPTEDISLNYAEIKWTYSDGSEKGKKGNVETEWKVEKGEK